MVDLWSIGSGTIVPVSPAPVRLDGAYLGRIAATASNVVGRTGA
jgi:hypothetical protein